MVGSDDRADSTGCTFAPVLAMYVTSSPLRKASLSVLEEPDTPSHDVARVRGATVPRPRRAPPHPCRTRVRADDAAGPRGRAPPGNRRRRFGVAPTHKPVCGGAPQ